MNDPFVALNLIDLTITINWSDGDEAEELSGQNGYYANNADM